jgi:transposase
MSHAFFFTREFFIRHNMTVVPHPPYSPDMAPCYLLSQLKINVKGRHFDMTEVIKALLIILVEHDFKDAFNEWQKHWKWRRHA